MLHRALLTTARLRPIPFRATPSPRLLHTTRARLQDAAAAPIRRPVGAFRGGLFGFLIGTVGAGAATYYYILEEYRVSNELLTEDIYALQAAVQRVEAYVRDLEEQVLGRQK